MASLIKIFDMVIAQSRKIEYLEIRAKENAEQIRLLNDRIEKIEKLNVRRKSEK